MLALLIAFNRIGRITNEAEFLGKVTYAYVQMYGKLLEKTEQIAAKEVASAHPTALLAPGTKKPSSKAQPKASRSTNVKDNSTMNAMTTFLCSVIDNLDAKNDTHKALFEGFTYMTLEKLGARLYTLVFGRPREATLEAEIIASSQPDEIEDPEGEASLNPKEVEVSVAKTEAPYLIHLLKHIMNAAPLHLDGNLSPGKSSKAKQPRSKALTKSALTVTAKERLQRTLVNCIFGTEGRDEEDEFMDCLKPPTVATSTLPMPKVKESDVQDWFKEEMWRLLGWDILSRDVDWSR